MVEFADKTVHNMGGGMDAKSGRVMLPGRHWAKFGELDVGYACNNNRASLKGPPTHLYIYGYKVTFRLDPIMEFLI